MEPFKHILFFANGAKGEKGALTNAIQLALHNQGTVTVMAVVQTVSTNDDRLNHSIARLQKAIIRERAGEIEQLIASIPANAGSPAVTVQVIPGDKDFIEVIRAVVKDKYDLLVKPVDPERALTTRLFGNKDLRLMRQCPCPVWIIKPGRRRLSTILAAVDLTSTNQDTTRLSERIVDIASMVTRSEAAKLHVLAAWEQPIEASLRKQLDRKTYDAYLDKYKERLRTTFAGLLVRAGLSGHGEHIVRGKPDAVITRYVHDYDVDLLIMGTLSRSGVPGLLIGNTAERVLDQVNCSVLTLKPKGFRTVIK